VDRVAFSRNHYQVAFLDQSISPFELRPIPSLVSVFTDLEYLWSRLSTFSHNTGCQSMSDDEYFLRDDLANLNNVDWGALLDAPTAAARRPTVQQRRPQPLPQPPPTRPQTSAFRPAVAQSSRNPQLQQYQHQPTPSTSASTPAIQQQSFAQPHVQVQINRPQTSTFRPAIPQSNRNQPPQPQQRQQPRHSNQVAAQAAYIPPPAPPAVMQTGDVIPNRVVSPASSNYFDDDDDDMDSSFLAELDRVERNALASSRTGNANATIATTSRESMYLNNGDYLRKDSYCP
jgi:hypothetical protein